MKVQFKGFIRGSHSEMERAGIPFPTVVTLEYDSLDGLIGLVLPEWIYTLRINGRRIRDPEQYLRKKGIWHQFIRRDAA